MKCSKKADCFFRPAHEVIFVVAPFVLSLNTLNKAVLSKISPNKSPEALFGGRKCRKPAKIVPLFITMPAVTNGPESKFTILRRFIEAHRIRPPGGSGTSVLDKTVNKDRSR